MHWPLFFSLVSISQSPAILCEGNEKIKQVPDIKELTLCLGQTSHMTQTVGKLDSLWEKSSCAVQPLNQVCTLIIPTL